ncbi:MAG: structural protein P5 [Rikenellaceae bacterium]
MSTTRGLRNNNPGNIRVSKTKWQGEVEESTKKDSAFEEFKDMAHGYRALLKLLQNYRKVHNLQTITEIISRWAPPIENNTAGYISRVCKEMGVEEGYVPNINDKEVMCSLAAAISQVENGVPAVILDIEAGWNLL